MNNIISSLIDLYVSENYCRVAMAYDNEKKLDAEAKQLQANAAQFAKQSMQWLQLVENFNGALKVSLCVCSKQKQSNCKQMHLNLPSRVCNGCNW